MAKAPRGTSWVPEIIQLDMRQLFRRCPELIPKRAVTTKQLKTAMPCNRCNAARWCRVVLSCDQMASHGAGARRLASPNNFSGYLSLR
eukprot:6210455-Pleurochrysis_carterae.AAC.4